MKLKNIQVGGRYVIEQSGVKRSITVTGILPPGSNPAGRRIQYAWSNGQPGREPAHPRELGERKVH